MKQEKERRREKMWELMTKLEIDKADIEFSGGGDDGGVDSLYLYKQTTDGYTLGIATTEKRFPVTSFMSDTLKAAIIEEMHSVAHDLYELEKLFYQLVDDEYGSFAGEFHVDGSYTVDLRTRTINT